MITNRVSCCANQIFQHSTKDDCLNIDIGSGKYHFRRIAKGCNSMSLETFIMTPPLRGGGMASSHSAVAHTKAATGRPHFRPLRRPAVKALLRRRPRPEPPHMSTVSGSLFVCIPYTYIHIRNSVCIVAWCIERKCSRSNCNYQQCTAVQSSMLATL